MSSFVGRPGGFRQWRAVRKLNADCPPLHWGIQDGREQLVSTLRKRAIKGTDVMDTDEADIVEKRLTGLSLRGLILEARTQGVGCEEIR